MSNALSKGVEARAKTHIEWAFDVSDRLSKPKLCVCPFTDTHGPVSYTHLTLPTIYSV